LIGTDWNNPFGDGNSSEIIVEDLKQLSKDDNFKKHKPSDYQFDISNSFKG
jgi:UDP-N-acetylglucosamine 2-epimerase